MNLIISSILLWLVLAFSSIISLHFATAFRNNSLMIILLNNPFTRVFYFASSRFTIIISVCSNIKGFLIISHIVLVFQSPPRLVLILFSTKQSRTLFADCSFRIHQKLIVLFRILKHQLEGNLQNHPNNSLKEH